MSRKKKGHCYAATCSGSKCVQKMRLTVDLFIFVLLNRGVPDVETIYFVLIEQKKYNFLQKLPGV